MKWVGCGLCLALLACAPLFAATPGANGRVAFQTDRDGAFQIGLVNPDGSAFRELTSRPWIATAPAWSPDGLRLAFVATDGTRDHLFVLDYLEGQAAEIFSKDGVALGHPAWSADGKKIAFEGVVSPATAADLWVVPSDGSAAPTPLTSTSDLDEREPAFSPDGTKLAYAANKNGDYDIFVAHADGTSPVALTTTADVDERSPDWSPDGAFIAVSRHAGSAPTVIEVLDAAGKIAPQTVSPDGVDAIQPAFSPDGKKIVFAGLVDTNRDLWTVDFPGGANLFRVTANPATDAKPSWQPVVAGTAKPPVANAGPDAKVECSSFDGGVVHLDGSASTADTSAGPNAIALWEWYLGYGTADESLLGVGKTLDVTLPLGSYEITLLVTDSFGQTATDQVTVVVQDTTPPFISVEVSPDTIWPPNHKMVPVHASVVARDLCGPVTVTLVSVVNSEADNGPGDGNTTGDVQGAAVGTADFDYLVRSERSGSGNGRTYTATYKAVDPSGNAATASAATFVPHDQGQAGGKDAPRKGAKDRAATAGRGKNR